MEEEKEKQMNVDVVDTPEGQSEMEHMAEERTAERMDENKTHSKEEEFIALFENDEAEKFHSQWLNIQSRFVDDPRASVEDADQLVADVIKSITRSFADRRISLENQWKSGENNTSTEDLRIAIKRYRSFFNRLLSLKS
jgi:tyrosyl-tRNA synthetase